MFKRFIDTVKEKASTVIEGFTDIANAIKDRIIHILEPHCSECEFAKREQVEYLKLLIEHQRQERIELINLLKPVKENETEPAYQAPIPVFTPWRVQREQRERASRMKAAELKMKNEHNKVSSEVRVPITTETVEKLEEELGIGEK